MTYVLAGVIVVMVAVLASCTLVQVEVSSDNHGQTTVEPDSLNITVNKEGQATGNLHRHPPAAP